MIRDPNRIEEMLSLLREVWTTYPDLRLGQLLVNVMIMDEKFEPDLNQVFFIEDEVMKKKLLFWMNHIELKREKEFTKTMEEL